ncbi:DNA methyltransferase [Rhodobacteraceae bacterium D3-12]|nr:DNA methyltransferase [Rhodobacteraceae bacterium D3-12]
MRSLSGRGAERRAQVELIGAAEPETQEVAVADLIVVAEFRDYIYPGVVSTGKVERGGDKPYHTVINGENFHALEALTFTHRGKIDVIYIDPPYNSGANDWKYNNDYVGKDDLYRHSKWLAFIERRLKVARDLLNPKASALVCSIDEKEFLNLGLLIKQVFPEARVQMVSSQINAKGIIRDNEFSRTNEFLFFAFLGAHRIKPEEVDVAGGSVRWASLRRSDVESARGTPKGGPEQFYPIYVDKKTGRIVDVGEPMSPDEPATSASDLDGCLTVLPIRDKGDIREMNWGLTAPTLKERLKKGFVKAVFSGRGKKKVTIYYLTTGPIQDIEEGRIKITGYEESGAAIVSFVEGKRKNPTTQWAIESHNAQSHGSDLIREIIPGREFPFPKSLYAVEDVLRILCGDNFSAVVLDFFSGSGTTAHAVMRLNRQDGGRRQCISVTNNEVAADEHTKLRTTDLRPGDPDWEKWGICDYITKPRIEATITGKTPEGAPIKGDYKFTDEFPMAEGFEENAEFFTLTYETPVKIAHNRAFARIAPLLWMRAGSEGRRIDKEPAEGWEVADTYGLLTNLDRAAPFCAEIAAKDGIRIAYIVTDDERRFQAITRELPAGVEPVRLYESYLTNFRFAMGR